MCGQASALGRCGLMEDLAYLLGAVVGDFDTDMRLNGGEGCAESVLLMLREPITRGAQEKPDLIEGIPCLRCPNVSCWTRRRTSPGAPHPTLLTRRYSAGLTLLDRVVVYVYRWNQHQQTRSTPLGGIDTTWTHRIPQKPLIQSSNLCQCLQAVPMRPE